MKPPGFRLDRLQRRPMNPNSERIQALKPLSGGWWQVDFEGGRKVRISEQRRLQFGVAVGAAFSPEAVGQLIALAQEDAARDDALRLLARRPYSRYQLEQRLLRRGHSPEAIAQTCTWLEQRGYLDDRAFAAAWVRSTLSRRPAGRRRLEFDLHRQGVDREAALHGIQQAFAERGVAAGPSGELTLAKAVLAQRLRRTPVVTAAVVRRWTALLRRRGFSWPTIRAALRASGVDEALLDTAKNKNVES